MLLGMDIGGTYSDGVLVEDASIIKYVKVPTCKDDFIKTIETLSRELDISSPVSRVVVSTTLMTNLIAEENYEETGLLLIPGPGLVYKESTFPFPFEIISGGQNFQGRVFKDINEAEVCAAARRLIQRGCKKLAINAKFTPRNHHLEDRVYECVRRAFPELELIRGWEISNTLNFIRRTVSSALSLATRNLYQEFIDSLKNTISYTDNIFILKSDGGIISLDDAFRYPVESIFSGPAASAFGALSLMKSKGTGIVIDIGGTTTDFALILDSAPLFSSKGLAIKSYKTTAKGISVLSIPIGGDTRIDVSSEGTTFSGKKVIPIVLGGVDLTLTDVLSFLKLIDIGNEKLVFERIKTCADIVGSDEKTFCDHVIDKFIDEVDKGLEAVIKKWENEPKYRVWQIENPKKLKPQMMVLMGGPSEALKTYFESFYKTEILVNEYSKTANALGAALAKKSFDSFVRINSEKNELATGWGKIKHVDIKNKIPDEEAVDLASKEFQSYLKEKDIEEEFKVISFEKFNIVRNGYMAGQIFEIRLGLDTGIINLNNGAGLYE